MNESEALGVDIGGVIIDRVSEDDPPQTMGHYSYAGAAAVEGAFEAIARLVQLVLMKWLEAHDFSGSTGIPSNRVLFCRQRHEKAAICRQLGVTHFIDDRLEVLSPPDQSVERACGRVAGTSMKCHLTA